MCIFALQIESRFANFALSEDLKMCISANFKNLPCQLLQIALSGMSIMHMIKVLRQIEAAAGKQSRRRDQKQ